MQKLSAHILTVLLILLTLAMPASQATAAEVLIIGDTRLKLVAEIISGIRKTLKSSITVYSSDDVKGTLRSVVAKEQPRIVIPLGRGALAEAQNLPAHITVIYGFVLTPSALKRPNTTGIYMATPAREYADLLNRHLHSIKYVAVVGSGEQLRLLNGGSKSRLDSYSVESSIELVDTLKTLSNTDAILLLPNAQLLTPATMEEVYLLSFRKRIPLLGISERQVRDGALLALVADLTDMGREIGEYASLVIRGAHADQLPPAPARRFDVYLNTETAKKMGIQVPDGLMRAAKGIVP
ncbi:ABC transporter substrate binding protein [Geobacter sp. OR-1]|uniref:ABC transporter substrate-binding protein n=1 Tax=Geobacter sp. OR-1 TaxID=1266765 RepID=UPI000542FB83|nr:ABC transporter substrate binding protein [Geobacter sp. OR-1]GAM10788.1 ABC transporter substrate binding protein [Geobacter sp. OR-1]